MKITNEGRKEKKTIIEEKRTHKQNVKEKIREKGITLLVNNLKKLQQNTVEAVDKNGTPTLGTLWNFITDFIPSRNYILFCFF